MCPPCGLMLIRYPVPNRVNLLLHSKVSLTDRPTLVNELSLQQLKTCTANSVSDAFHHSCHQVNSKATYKNPTLIICAGATAYILHSNDIWAFVFVLGSYRRIPPYEGFTKWGNNTVCICLHVAAIFIFNDLKLQAYLVQYSLISQFPRT